MYEELIDIFKYIFETSQIDYKEYLKRIIYDDESEETYIEFVDVGGSIRGYNRKYFKLTCFALNVFNTFAGTECYQKIIDLMDKLDYIDRHKHLDGYSLAIAQHTTLAHYSNIKYLINVLDKENISYKDKHHETSIRVKDTRYRVEWDLILRYNNKDYGVEVECGTTSNKDMQRKIWKHNLLAVHNNKFKTVIVACPNKNILDKTKTLIEKNVDDYWEEYKRKDMRYKNPFNVEYIYINLSTINSKNKLGKLIKRNQIRF